MANDLRTTATILAIGNDADEAAWVNGAVRRRVKADLVRARSVAEAIRAMETRVPDLLLVPALLSPRDESALMEAVRANPAAAHVQMLTVPVPTQAESGSTPRGFLSRFRREQTASESPAGSMAAAFADQIAASLKRAQEARAGAAGHDAAETDVAEPVARPEPQVAPAPAATTELESDAGIVLELGSDQLAAAEVFATFAEFTVAPEPAPTPEASARRAAAPAGRKTPARRSREARPAAATGVEEQWRDLDPLQSGFAVLLARLREVTGGGAAAGSAP